MRSFPKPTDADERWTRISIPVRRYGYAYSFQGITIYLSVALLCFHAAMVVVHVLYRVFIERRTFEIGGSLGSLLILAMGDKAPSGGNMWATRVAVLSTGNENKPNQLKLEVLEGESGNEEEVGRAEPEEVMRLVGTGHFDKGETRYPSFR